MLYTNTKKFFKAEKKRFESRAVRKIESGTIV